MAKFTDLPSLGQSLAGTEVAALVANVSSTLTTVQLPLSTIKTFVLNGTATTATNVASGGANQIPYQSAANTTAFAPAPVTAGTALIWNGTSIAWGGPTIIGTTLTGLLKGNGTLVSAATANVDYQSAQSVTGIVKSTGTTRSAATSGTDYAPGTSALATGIVKSTTTTGTLTIAVSGTDYQAAVSATGLLKSNGTSGNVSAAVAGTDYFAPTSTTANYVLASPNGSAGTPTFRALVNADLPTTITATAAIATTSSTAASLGYLGMPQQSKSSAYTTVIGDAGKHIYVTATATMTIDSNANVAYPIGTAIAFIAAAGATVTIAITTDVMYLGGTGTTGSRTLAAYGMATAVKVTSTSWFINGTGLT